MSYSLKYKRYTLIVISIFFIATSYALLNFAGANDLSFIDDFNSYSIGSLEGQGGWELINYYGNPNNSTSVKESDFDKSKFIKLVNYDSFAIQHDIAPLISGVIELQLMHNKSGTFYFYPLTSDQGGQILLSIQFTESGDILLEHGSEQIILLNNYTANQWYTFTIDFDNSRGEHGTFKIKVDGGEYNEYEYVNSQSEVFDLAKIVFGSDTQGIIPAISAIGYIKLIPPTVEPEVSADPIIPSDSNLPDSTETSTSTSVELIPKPDLPATTTIPSISEEESPEPDQSSPIQNSTSTPPETISISEEVSPEPDQSSPIQNSTSTPPETIPQSDSTQPNDSPTN